MYLCKLKGCVGYQDKVRPWVKAHRNGRGSHPSLTTHLQGIEKTEEDTHKWTGKMVKKKKVKDDRNVKFYSMYDMKGAFNQVTQQGEEKELSS